MRPILYSTSMFDFGKIERAGPAAAGDGLRRLPRPLPAAHAGVQGRADRVPRRLLLPVPRPQPGLRPLRARPGAGYRARRRARSFRTSRISGWCARSAQDRTLDDLRACSTARASTGAYRFDIRPGTITQVEVTEPPVSAPRAIEKLGMAPLTSMFLFGENPSGRSASTIFAPKCTTATACRCNNGAGEWLWRPLTNPNDACASAASSTRTRKGFGLAQRDRDFRNYQDNESRFERRPSYWVEPLGHWGKGSVELRGAADATRRSTTTSSRTGCRPRRAEARKPLTYSYVMSVCASTSTLAAGRQGDCYPDRQRRGRRLRREVATTRRVLVDFAGGDLDGLNGAQPVRAEVKANGGDVDAVTVEQIPGTGTWRVAFRLTPKRRRSRSTCAAI